MALQRAMFFASFLHSAFNNEVFAEFYTLLTIPFVFE